MRLTPSFLDLNPRLCARPTSRGDDLDVHAACFNVKDKDGGAMGVCASVLVWQLQGRVDAACLFGQRLDQL